MGRPTVAPALLSLAAALLLAGCGPAAPPAVKGKPLGPAAAHDHGGHDHQDGHEGHDHAPPGGAAQAEAGGAEDGGHDHHHPETLAELVGELVKLAAVVKEGMEANVREKADSPVHEFGHFVGDLEGLAKEAKLPAEVEAAVIKAGNDLFEAFDKLDQAIHGSGDIAEAWGQQAASIEAGLKTLQDAVAK